MQVVNNCEEKSKSRREVTESQVPALGEGIVIESVDPVVSNLFDLFSDHTCSDRNPRKRRCEIQAYISPLTTASSLTPFFFFFTLLSGGWRISDNRRGHGCHQ